VWKDYHRYLPFLDTIYEDATSGTLVPAASTVRPMIASGMLRLYPNIVIFICFSTKAVYLELVQDLSTNAFLNVLRRLILTRGKPARIWSDNATNFVGARDELKDLKHLFLNTSHFEASGDVNI